jgi:hypothetical protein
MSVRLVADVLDHVHGIPHGSKLVLICMADYANKEGICWPSFQSIADRADMSRRHAIRVVEELVKSGYLSVAEQRPYKPTLYRLHIPSSDAHVTSDTDDTSDAHVTTLVTPTSLGSDAHVTSSSDIAMSPEPSYRTINEPSLEPLVEKATSKPKKAMPENGPAQHIVKVWSELSGVPPSNYGKAVKAGQNLSAAGVTDGELGDLYEFMASNPYWSREGFDLTTAYGQLDKFRTKQRTPARPLAEKESMAVRNRRNVQEGMRMANGRKPESSDVYDTTGVVR